MMYEYIMCEYIFNVQICMYVLYNVQICNLNIYNV